MYVPNLAHVFIICLNGPIADNNMMSLTNHVESAIVISKINFWNSTSDKDSI